MLSPAQQQVVNTASNISNSVIPGSGNVVEGFIQFVQSIFPPNVPSISQGPNGQARFVFGNFVLNTHVQIITHYPVTIANPNILQAAMGGPQTVTVTGTQILNETTNPKQFNVIGFFPYNITISNYTPQYQGDIQNGSFNNDIVLVGQLTNSGITWYDAGIITENNLTYGSSSNPLLYGNERAIGSDLGYGLSVPTFQQIYSIYEATQGNGNINTQSQSQIVQAVTPQTTNPIPSIIPQISNGGFNLSPIMLIVLVILLIGVSK